MRKRIVIVLGICILTLGLMTNFCSAQTYNFSTQGRLGVGILSSTMNLGLGPSLEFWLTPNIGVLGYLSALFDYTSYGARLEFMFDRPFYIGTTPNKPYIGAGYVGVQGPEQTGGGYGYTWKVEQEGSGVEIHAGALHQATWLSDKVFLRGEFIFYAFELETKGTSNFGYETSIDTDWNSFTLGVGIHYMF